MPHRHGSAATPSEIEFQSEFGLCRVVQLGAAQKKKKKKTRQGVTLFDQYKVYRYTVALKGGIGDPSNPPIIHSYRGRCIYDMDGKGPIPSCSGVGSPAQTLELVDSGSDSLPYPSQLVSCTAQLGFSNYHLCRRGNLLCCVKSTPQSPTSSCRSSPTSPSWAPAWPPRLPGPPAAGSMCLFVPPRPLP